MCDHKTNKICMKFVDVDINIIPLVKWLNTFEYVFTKYSCQGNKDKQPYVLFYCGENRDIVYILDKTEKYSKMSINSYRGYLRYVLRFNSCESLSDFYKNELKIELQW